MGTKYLIVIGYDVAKIIKKPQIKKKKAPKSFDLLSGARCGTSVLSVNFGNLDALSLPFHDDVEAVMR